MRLTIGKKLNTVVSGLLFLGIGLALTSVVVLYRDNLENLVRKTSTDTCAVLAINIRAELQHLAELARTLGAASLEDFRYSEDRIRFIQEGLSADPRLLSLAVYRSDRVDWRILNSHLPPKIKLTQDDFKTLDRDFPLGLGQARTGDADFRAALLRDGTPILRAVFPFVQKQDKTFSSFLVMEFLQERIASVFSEITQGVSFLVNRDGHLLATSHPLRFALGTNLAPQKLFQSALRETVDRRQMTTTDSVGNSQFGAFQKVGFAGLVVATQIPEALATEHVTEITRRSLFLTLGLIGIALLIGFFFSRSLTQPIRALESAALRVKGGDFSVRLATLDDPDRGDEIAQFSETFNSMVKGLEERDAIRSTFSKFHSKEIAEKLLAGEVALGGEKREATVLFTDIRGFTSMSERLAPEVLISVLNRYMSVMVTIVTEHGGIVDKYIGDAILAVWGVPIQRTDDPCRAVRACLEMRTALQKLNEEFKAEGLPTIKMGMGLNHGPLIAGNIGSQHRMEYTIIGDTVNTAARIESFTKNIGTDLLIGQNVVNQIADQFILERARDAVALRGKSESLAVYEVSGYVDRGERIIVESPYAHYGSDTVEKTPTPPKPPRFARDPKNLPTPTEYAPLAQKRKAAESNMSLNALGNVPGNAPATALLNIASPPAPETAQNTDVTLDLESIEVDDDVA